MRRVVVVAGLAATVLIMGAVWFGLSRTEWASQAGTAAHRKAGPPPPAVTVAGTTATLTWTARDITPSVPVSEYEITRYDATGESTPAQSGCLGRVSRLSCVETGLPDGEFRYTVRPVQGTRRGAESTASEPVRVATVTISFPMPGGVYGTASYAAGCGAGADICGTALLRRDADLSRIQVSVRVGDKYWEPFVDRFIAGSERFMNGSAVTFTPAASASAPATAAPSGSASGTLAVPPLTGLPVQPQPEALHAVMWRAVFPVRNFPDDARYTVRVVARDTRGRTSSAASTFRVLPRPPAAPVFTGKPSSLSNTSLATFTFRAGAGARATDLTFACAVDTMVATTCASGYTTPILGPGRHTFHVQAFDKGGNVGPESSYSWNIDSIGPRALDVQASNGINLVGRLGAGDAIRLTFDKDVVPGSVVDHWSGGQALDITVRAVPGSAAGPETLFFYDKANAKQLRGIGTVTLGQGSYITGTETVVIPATLTLDGDSLLITLGSPEGGRRLVTSTLPSIMIWYPGLAHDKAGNRISAPSGGAVEQGPPDVDF